jgi:hypothetical protein
MIAPGFPFEKIKGQIRTLRSVRMASPSDLFILPFYEKIKGQIKTT